MALEWWYVNARLQTEQGRDLSLAFAVFQIQLPNSTPYRLAHFFPNPIYVGHYSVSDITNKTFHYEERSSFVLANPRVKHAHAFARSESLDIELGNWSLRRENNGQYRANFSRFNQDQMVLTMTPTRPEVPHGKGYVGTKETTGRLSYYSATRLEAVGLFRGEPVRGIAWLDHQWGGENGINDAVFEPRWDWFSMNLTDGRDIMAYRLRDADNTILEQAASVTFADGTNRIETITMQPTRYWQADTGANYPVEWEMQLEDQSKLKIEAVFDAQELDASITVGHPYWEGAINISGDQVGTGFMELPGYTKQPHIFKKPFHWLWSQLTKKSKKATI